MGKNVDIQSLSLDDFDCITIHDNVHIEENALIQPSQLTHEGLVIQPITIESNSTLRNNSLLTQGQRLPGDCVLHPLHTQAVQDSNPPFEAISSFRRFLSVISSLLTAFVLVPYILLFAIYLAVFLSDLILYLMPFAVENTGRIFLSIAISLITIPLLTTVLKRLLTPKQVKYAKNHFYDIKKNLVSKLLSISDNLLIQFGASEIYYFWLKCCGLKMGKNCAITPGTNLIHHVDWVTIGDGVFFSTCQLNTSFQDRQGNIQHQPIVMGHGSFISLEAFIDRGVKIEKDAGTYPFVYVPPQYSIREGSLYNGRSAVKREVQKKSAFHNSKLKLFLFHLLRVLCFSLTLFLTLSAVQLTRASMEMPFLLSFVIGFWTAKFTYLFQLILVKWLVKFKFRPRKNSLMDPGIQKDYIFFIPYTWMCQSYIFAEWKGTMVLNQIFRLLGASIGKDAIINTQVINDWDLVSIGARSLINDNVRITGHMLAGGVAGEYINDFTHIGRDCVIHSKANIIAKAKLSSKTIIKTGSPVIYHRAFGTVKATD